MTGNTTQKLHPNLVEGVEQALDSALRRGVPADKVLMRLFRDHPKWGGRDRAFIAETTYAIVRYLRHYVNGIGPDTDWRRVIGWHLLDQGFALPPWPGWEGLRPLPRKKDEPLAVTESITDWLDRKGREGYGNRWPALLHALNEVAPVVLRINPLRCTLEEARAALDELGIVAEPRGDLALELMQRADVFRTEPFRAGWFEVQDLASQQVAPALHVLPGQRIVDACAGAGGKSLHIAALTGNKGQIIALDTEEFKLLELRKRAARAGVSNIETRAIDDLKVVKRLYGTADRLLLDVPCTGTGVLRRNPDIKWKIGQVFLDKVTGIQADILQRYSPICKPGGLMVYATCSILPEENGHQVRAFLQKNPGFRLVEEKQLLPDDFGYDGFYIATIERITNPTANEGSPDAP